MVLFVKQNIWIFNVLLILMLFDGRSNSLSLADLKRVCLYYFPFDTNRTIVDPPDGFCTALSSYNGYGRQHPHNRTRPHKESEHKRNPSGSNGSIESETSKLRPNPRDEEVNENGIQNNDKINPTVQESIPSTLKRDLPYVYVYVADNIDSIVQSILPDYVQFFVDILNKLITDNSVDIMVFDFLDQSDDNVYEYTDDFENNLKSFFELMKKKHPGLLFGLKLHKNVDVNKSVFNLKIIDGVVDFYVVNSYDYTPCKYNKSQNNMAKPPSPDELKNAIKSLHSIGYDVQKLFLTIQIVVKSWKKKHKHAPEEWSYSWMCVAHPGKKRRYCRGTLDNYYQQGRVIFDLKLSGVFIQSIDCDDFLGHCDCGPFPATRAIYDGLSGSPQNTTLTGCTTFGLLPKEH